MSVSATIELDSDQDRYDAAFDLADELISADPTFRHRLAELADAINTRDPRIGRDFAMTAVLSLPEN